MQKIIFAFYAVLLIASFNCTIAQLDTTASAYYVGSSRKQIMPDSSYDFYNNTPYNFGVSIGNQSTATVIGRSIRYFNVPSTIPSGSQVYKVELIYQTYNSNDFYAIYISNLPDNPTLGQVWNAVGEGSSIGIFIGSSGSTSTPDVTSSLKDIVQNAVNSSNKKINIGFMSATEVSNVPNTQIINLGLKIYYNRAVVFTVLNNFNAGGLILDGGYKANGMLYPIGWTEKGHNLMCIV